MSSLVQLDASPSKTWFRTEPNRTCSCHPSYLLLHQAPCTLHFSLSLFLPSSLHNLRRDLFACWFAGSLIRPRRLSLRFHPRLIIPTLLHASVASPSWAPLSNRLYYFACASVHLPASTHLPAPAHLCSSVDRASSLATPDCAPLSRTMFAQVLIAL